MNQYKLHIFIPEEGEVYYDVESYSYESKPTFEDMYAKIGCDMIQPSTAYLPKYSNRKDGYVEFWMDEESLMKHPVPNVNKEITSAWYDWQRKTGHQALPGSKIHGKVAVIQKLKNKKEEV